MTNTMSKSEIEDNPSLLVPSFLPHGDVLGWNLTSIVNPVTKRKEYTYTVCVQTDGAFGSSENADVVLVKCDGPCGNQIPSNHLISMGKCDHLLCKACFGLVKNPDGSYGCSNFFCWSEPQKDVQKEQDKYNKIINKQMFRAQKFKKYGDYLKTSTNIPTSSEIISELEMNSTQPVTSSNDSSIFTTATSSAPSLTSSDSGSSFLGSAISNLEVTKLF